MSQKLPFRVEIVNVTPALAREWLSRMDSNRNVSTPRVEMYARDMKAGKWQLSPEGIQFDTQGQLTNGQHRLHAVVKAGVSVQMVVFWDVPASVKATLDTGRVRSAADMIRILLGEKNAALKASVTRMLIRFNYAHLRRASVFSNDEVLSALYQWSDQIHWATSGPPMSPRLPTPIIAAVAFIHPLDPEKTTQFRDQLYTGQNLAEDDPVLVLRKWVMGSNGRRETNRGDLVMTQAENTLQTYKNFERGVKLKTLGSPKTEVIDEFGARLRERNFKAQALLTAPTVA